MGKLHYLEMEEHGDQYKAYCEEQDSLERAFLRQEHERKITESIEFLENNGYTVLGKKDEASS